MMKVMLKEVAQAKGFENAKALTDAMAGHFGTRISYSTIYPLWDDTAQNFSRTTLDRLCTFLQVPLGMLIQFIDTESLPQAGGDRAQATPERRSPVKTKRKTKHTSPLRLITAAG
jgi:DNA-binding Xre family transcriptional regulator